MPTKKPRFPANPDAPQFTPELWKREDGSSVSANCIAYAYSGSKTDGTNIVSDESLPQLGYTAGYLTLSPDLLTEKGLEWLMEREGVEWAGKKPLKDNPNAFEVPPAKSGHYLIGLYLHKDSAIGKSFDFHFVRQDADGGWSEKMASDPIERAFPPAKDGGYQPLINDHLRHYYFAGYGYIPKSGIDAGIEEGIIPSMLMEKVYSEDKCGTANNIMQYFVNRGINAEKQGELAKGEGEEWGKIQIQKISQTLKKYNVQEGHEIFESCRQQFLGKLREKETLQVP